MHFLRSIWQAYQKFAAMQSRGEPRMNTQPFDQPAEVLSLWQFSQFCEKSIQRRSWREIHTGDELRTKNAESIFQSGMKYSNMMKRRKSLFSFKDKVHFWFEPNVVQLSTMQDSKLIARRKASTNISRVQPYQHYAVNVYKFNFQYSTGIQ